MCRLQPTLQKRFHKTRRAKETKEKTNEQVEGNFLALDSLDRQGKFGTHPTLAHTHTPDSPVFTADVVDGELGLVSALDTVEDLCRLRRLRS